MNTERLSTRLQAVDNSSGTFQVLRQGAAGASLRRACGTPRPRSAWAN